MEYYISQKVFKSGDGSKEKPFKTIGEAAALAAPGDEVIVLPGVYRENIDPACGGSEDARIVYRAEEPGTAVITGAEELCGWEQYKGNTWRVKVSNSVFGDYNPYTTVIRGDWYFADNPVHTGDVYVDGKSLYEVLSLDEVLDPKPFKMSWEPDEVTIKKWYTEQEGDTTVIYVNIGGDSPNDHNMEFNVRRNCFMPKEEGIGYITVSGFVLKQAATQWAPPTAYQDGLIGPHWSKGWIIEDCEISDSRCSGISLGKYLQPDNENKWTRFGLKDGTQTQRDCVMQAINDGWSKETIGSHIIRRCHIHDCGQTGIVGHLGGVFSVIEDNHIHHINNKQDLAGAEIGGIKMHAAIDVIYRRNHIHHCTRGIWLDWQAQGTRVTGNLFHDNTPPKGTDITPLLGLGEDIFVEVSHGPTLLDNNLFLSPCACRFSTQGVAMVHNLIMGSFTWVDAGVENGGAYLPTPRYTPYHVPHSTLVAGFMTFMHGDMRFYNNIFIKQPVREDYVAHAKKTGEEKQYNFECGLGVYEDYPTTEEYMAGFGPWKPTDEGAKDKYYEHLPVDAAGNAYYNGAISISKESNAYIDSENSITTELYETADGVVFKTNLGEFLPKKGCDIISTATLGEAFEPEQRFENPDGSEIIFNEDYYGTHRGVHTIPGPFNDLDRTEFVLCHS
ncbi:MAG: right-handed parallel beta-helix repeat-containing protein [Lachnospiraceae bacterium]|nr:right-handed parallel beta-helix repeat-containing protein [Lachnospiraceae bacterium]